MPLNVADRVRDTTTTTGTGTITLSGTPPTGYQSFSAVGNGNTTYYTINAGSQWEVGIGTYLGAGPTLSRDTVLSSSNGGSLVNFAAGTKDVFCDYPASKSISDGFGTLPIANGGTGSTSAPAALTALGAYPASNPNGYTSNTGTVTSVAGTGTVNGITLTGTVTTSGSLTLGGTLSGVSLTSQVTGTLPVANGGTGVTTSTGTGSVVLSNSPTLVTPTLGAASATSIANALGAVGTPSYTFTGDTNTGIYSPAADTIAFVEGGVEAMRIDSSANVGIGTSSPFDKLHVEGNTLLSWGADNKFWMAFSNDYRMGMRLSSDTRSATIFATGPAGDGGSIRFNTRAATASGATDYGLERMRIDSSGNVGIGTSSPGSKLDVVAQDAIRITGFQPFQTWRDSNDANKGFRIQTAGGATLFSNDATGGGTYTEQFRILSTGGITSANLADAVGYKGLPQNQQVSAYTLVLADMGKHIYATAGAFAITIPANATTAFPIGTAITIVVEDAGKTVVPASGVTLVLAGTGAATTGTRTMAIGSVATIIKVGTNRWYISGSGVT